MRDKDDNKGTNLLRLAVKCRLLSPENEAVVLSIFQKQKEKTLDISIVRILKEYHFLSEEELNFLSSVKHHLSMKMQDKRFGELGIANRFIKPGNVQKALEKQSELFQTTRKNILIGDILLEKKEITKANKAAILLTQDRIEDAFLVEAFNDIATNEIERIQINMRFGAISVKKGYVSLAQLNQALKIQKKQERQQKKKTYIGEIFQKHFGLSQEDLTTVLTIQKKLEKQRLALEKALSRYHIETSSSKHLNKMLTYRFSKHKLAAFISANSPLNNNIALSEFTAWLDSIGITHGLCSRKKMQVFLDRAIEGTEIKIAQGTRPVAGKDGTTRFYFNLSPRKKQKQPSQTPFFVKEGDILAKTVPPTEGAPGMDVSGFKISPSPGQTHLISCGNGVLRQKDLFLAETAGIPKLFKKRTLFVTPTDFSCPEHCLSGSINRDLGDEYLDADLTINGDIESEARVLCHNILVNGNVQGKIQATGRIHIMGSVTFDSQTDLSENLISADGEIIIHKNIQNAFIVTSQRLNAPNADLYASNVHAYEEIILKNVTAPGKTTAHLMVGKKPFLKAAAINNAIREKKQQLAKLCFKEELDEIEAWFDKKIQMQDQYLEQQTTLQSLLNLPPEKIPQDLSDTSEKANHLFLHIKTDLIQTDSDRTQPYGVKEFIASVLEEIKTLPREKRQACLQQMQEIKYGMYKASVAALRRHKNEYKARKEMVIKKIEAASADINRVRQEIEDLSVKKDYLKFKEAERSSMAIPTIRIKNQVQLGTRIKTPHADLTVDQTMYGVKFSEKPRGEHHKPEIIIGGFYE